MGIYALWLALLCASQVQVWSSRPLLSFNHLNGHPQSFRATTDMAVIFASTHPDRGQWGISVFLVERGQKGFETTATQAKMGLRSTPIGDIELTEEMASDEHDDETDIIPPISTGENSILESEVLPEDDDYDMSVIVDATKMPDPEDVTERDLEAIAVDDEDETLITGDYTVSQEVDYKILELDYEDEMTATQALNAEIQKAAEDLAIRMDDDEPVEDETAQMPLATVHELDVTAQLPRDDSAAAISDDDDTGVNPTVNMDVDDKTVEMTDEGTVEMPKKGGEAG